MARRIFGGAKRKRNKTCDRELHSREAGSSLGGRRLFVPSRGQAQEATRKRQLQIARLPSSPKISKKNPAIGEKYGNLRPPRSSHCTLRSRANTCEPKGPSIGLVSRFWWMTASTHFELRQAENTSESPVHGLGRACDCRQAIFFSVPHTA